MLRRLLPARREYGVVTKPGRIRVGSHLLALKRLVNEICSLERSFQLFFFGVCFKRQGYFRLGS